MDTLSSSFFGGSALLLFYSVGAIFCSCSSDIICTGAATELYLINSLSVLRFLCCSISNTDHNYKLWFRKDPVLPTRSQVKVATQYMVWFIPDTNWRCFALETRSSMRNKMNEAGMKDRAKMTLIAVRTSVTLEALENKNTTCLS